MGVHFSHYEAKEGVRVRVGEHASVLRRLVGKATAVFIATPDPEPQRGKK